MTIHGYLIAVKKGTYTKYVFQDLDAPTPTYITCTRFPNWNCKELLQGMKGFVEFTNIKAGVTTWYDGVNLVPYKYDAIQFIDFIDEYKYEC